MWTSIKICVAVFLPVALATTVPTYCAPGHYISEEYGCIACPDHLFQPNANERSCWTCPYASTPNAERTLCICNPGTFWNTTVNFCMQCPPGTRTIEGDMFTCHPCPLNTYQPAFGSSSCLSCTPNSFAGYGATGCTSCRRGQVLIDGVCSTCPSGQKYDARSGKCSSCLLGYVNASGQCKHCPPGQRRNARGTGCTGCGPNEALVDGECKSCDAGTRYDSSRGKCVRCGPNEYRPSRTAEGRCLRCPPPARPNAERTQCLVCFSNLC